MKSETSPDKIVQKVFEQRGDLMEGKQYHTELPADISSWYCYIQDCGHSILSLIEGHYDESSVTIWDYLVPCPVKAVLKEYKIINGYPVVPLHYDEVLGLITEPQEQEFDKLSSALLAYTTSGSLFEVGKPFPKSNPLPGVERCLATLNVSFFDILCYLNGPTEKEIEDWRNGKLRYGFFTKGSLLLFILEFTASSWSIDAPINVLKIRMEEDRNSWLGQRTNTMNLFLIDARTNVLKAARYISISIADEIREILAKQAAAYSSANELEQDLMIICNSITTDQMIQRGKMISL